MVCVCVCVCGPGGNNRKDPNINSSEEFGTRKLGGGYHKFRLNGNEGFNKLFGVGVLKNLLVAKGEINCIRFVVSPFPIVIGKILAKY